MYPFTEKNLIPEYCMLMLQENVVVTPDYNYFCYFVCFYLILIVKGHFILKEDCTSL